MFLFGCGGRPFESVDLSDMEVHSDLVDTNLEDPSDSNAIDIPPEYLDLYEDVGPDLDAFTSSEDKLFFDGDISIDLCGEDVVDIPDDELEEPEDVPKADEITYDDGGDDISGDTGTDEGVGGDDGGEDGVGDADADDGLIDLLPETKDTTEIFDELEVDEPEVNDMVDEEICAPVSENDPTCDGIDDDCDGETDEDYIVQATGCGIGECLAGGLLECIGGGEVDSCVPLQPENEVCDEMDNDCDGSADEICLYDAKQKDLYVIAYTDSTKLVVMPKGGLESIITSAAPPQEIVDISIEYCEDGLCSAPPDVIAEGLRLCNFTYAIPDGCLENPPSVVADADLLKFKTWLPPGNSIWDVKEGTVLRGEFSTSENQLGYTAGLISYTEGQCVYAHSTFVCK